MNKNIVEGMRDMDPLTSVACSSEAADEIESMRQQLDEWTRHLDSLVRQFCKES